MSITIAKQNAVNAKCKLCAGSITYWCQTISVTAIWEQYSASIGCPQVNISTSGEWICVFWYIRSPQKANTVYFYHTDLLPGNKQQWQPQMWGSKHLTLIFLCIEEQHKVECCLYCGFRSDHSVDQGQPRVDLMTDTHKAAAEAVQADTDDRGTQITSHLNAWQLRKKVPHNHTMGCIMAFQGLPLLFLDGNQLFAFFFSFFFIQDERIWLFFTQRCSNTFFSSSVSRRKRTCGLFNFRLAECYIFFCFQVGTGFYRCAFLALIFKILVWYISTEMLKIINLKYQNIERCTGFSSLSWALLWIEQHTEY